jgi:glycosyltransferase involved in cell wall biosynthesis
MKILFAATYPDQPIGYGKIANILSNFLASIPGVELIYFGFSNFRNTAISRYIHPSITFIDVVAEEKKIGSSALYGHDIIEHFMNLHKPDVLFLYNDIIVISHIYNSLLEYRKNNKYKSIAYLDLVYDYERLDLLRHVDKNTDAIFTFSEYWTTHLIQLSISPNKVFSFPHGFSSDILSKKEKHIARSIIGIHPDDFVVLNTNRNSYRKAHDISFRAFLMFLKMNNCNPLIKLFINMYYETDYGYNIFRIIETECVKLGLDYNTIIQKHILASNNMPGAVTDEYINDMYNACDIGINTALGEGFGLCNMEHAALGHPQIVSAVGGLTDIFSQGNSVLIKPVASISIPNHMDAHGGDIHICSATDFANAMDMYYKNPDLMNEHGQKISEDILSRYSWQNILQKFSDDLIKVLF